MREGETIIEIEETDEAWWTGTTANGQRGLFPCMSRRFRIILSDTYVDLIQLTTLNCKNEKDEKDNNVVRMQNEQTTNATLSGRGMFQLLDFTDTRMIIFQMIVFYFDNGTNTGYKLQEHASY